MKRIEEIIVAYWEVGTALRHPDAPPLSCQDAITLLRQSDRLLPIAEETKLIENMHTLRYDIIEGNTEWRKNEKRVVGGTLLTLPTKE